MVRSGTVPPNTGVKAPHSCERNRTDAGPPGVSGSRRDDGCSLGGYHNRGGYHDRGRNTEPDPDTANIPGCQIQIVSGRGRTIHSDCWNTRALHYDRCVPFPAR